MTTQETKPRIKSDAEEGGRTGPTYLTITGSGVVEIDRDGTIRSRDLMNVRSCGKNGLRIFLGPVPTIQDLMGSLGTKEVLCEPPEPPTRCVLSEEPCKLRVDHFGTSNTSLLVDGVDVTSLVRAHLYEHGVCVTCREYRPSSTVGLAEIVADKCAVVHVSRRALRSHCNIQAYDSSILTLCDGFEASALTTSLSARLSGDAILESENNCGAFQDLGLVLHDRARCKGLVYLNSIDYELYDASKLSVSTPRGSGASRGIKREGASFILTECVIPYIKATMAPTTTTAPTNPAEASSALRRLPSVVSTPTERKRAPPATSKIPEAKASRLLPSSQSVRFSVDRPRNGRVEGETK